MIFLWNSIYLHLFFFFFCPCLCRWDFIEKLDYFSSNLWVIWSSTHENWMTIDFSYINIFNVCWTFHDRHIHESSSIVSLAKWLMKMVFWKGLFDDWKMNSDTWTGPVLFVVVVVCSFSLHSILEIIFYLFNAKSLTPKWRLEIWNNSVGLENAGK